MILTHIKSQNPQKVLIYTQALGLWQMFQLRGSLDIKRAIPRDREDIDLGVEFEVPGWFRFAGKESSHLMVRWGKRLYDPHLTMVEDGVHHRGLGPFQGTKTVVLAQ